MKKVLMVAALGASLAGCSGNGSNNSCVARGTQVLTPDGYRPIEDLRVGDLVFAFDEDSGERFATEVVAIKSAMREVGSVEVAGVKLHMTTDHPVYCPRDEVYAPAGDWYLGKRTALAVASEDGFRVMDVTWTRTFVEVTEVFDITVAHELHNFVANGVLVHNKSPVCEEDCYQEDLGTNVVTNNVATNNTATNNTATNNASDMGAQDTGTSADMGADATTSDMGTARLRGSCETSADCNNPDWTCITIPANDPEGYHTCQPSAAAEPGCATIEAPDNCCLHSDCNQADPSGTCVTGPIFYCGGVAPIIANVCLYDECAADAECGADEICLPPRVLGEPVARCVPAGCRTDADCDSRAGGQCSEFFDPCNRRLTGFHCTYDDSVCRADADCPPDGMSPGSPYCAAGTGDGDTACLSFAPPP